MRIILLNELDQIHKMALFEKIYAIYTKSFPVAEQKNYAKFKLLFNADNYYIFSLNSNEKLTSCIGFCIYAKLNYVNLGVTSNFYLIEYLAIDQQQKNKGLGSFLLHKSSELLCKQQPLPIFAEVEQALPQHDDYLIRCKRINFYHKLGFKAVEKLNYIMPLYGNNCADMYLFYLDITHKFSPNKQQLKNILTSIYQQVYQLDNDIRIEQMLHKL